MTTMSPPGGHRNRAPGISLAAILACLLVAPACAQDTTIYVDLPDATAWPGEPLRIPVILTNLQDTIVAYTVRFSLSRPDLVYFDAADLIDSTGTLTESWEYSWALLPGGVNLGIEANGMADLPLPPFTPGIPPLTIGETLVKFVVQVPCDPDTIFGNTVYLTPVTVPDFSRRDGQLIVPVSVSGNLITVQSIARGDLDHSGAFDLIDVVRAVNCIFRNDCPACTATLADVDCDGDVDVQDVIHLIEHVFRGGPVPSCP
jgi:hypothetical protein